ncbi:TolB domain-containing protein [Neobacillus sp. OS1-2]|uniref:TolB family protein n=1 Tax=Neobacillus sp. OS1-2 TaxID=3070680 RepID=UPI0027E1FB85|nr:TolB domain-containing protein [Neobacillus sp. OS1-2]WML40894.1 TolB domain-containing protein [Neobacillus sp. OS1-2]
MKKKLCFVLMFLLLLPMSLVNAETVNENSVKVAFIRDGFLWTKMNGKEEKITKVPGKYDYPPQWSHDGNWIAYQVEAKKKLNSNMESQTEIWVYHLKTKKHKRITLDGTNPKWSPVENILAFKSGGVLNVSNLEHFYNIALGVGDYNWYPDGRSFITASGASLRPDGWTNPVLFQIRLEKNFAKLTSLTKNVKKLYTIPSELKKGNRSLLAIDAYKFQFSPDGKWISFVVSPTASWSMDSNFVCVISSDGQNFEVMDEMNGDSIVKWSFHKNRLGYIAGGGRIVFGFKDKNMKVTELPTFNSISLTPPKFAELGFTWMSNHSLVVSRVKESPWSNDAKQRPDPSLFLIKIDEQKQTQITHPPKDYGDYDPIYIPAVKKLSWLRFTDLVDLQRDLWIADQNGENARIWIKNVNGYDSFSKN